MADPWDSFPFPTRGDTDDANTYEGVGRVLSQWEAVEFQLSQVYSVYVADPDGDAMQQYGVGRIFRDRIASLRVVSQPYFINRPNQALEAQFDSLGRAATGFADRRNEVAHGMVMQSTTLRFFWRYSAPIALNTL